MRYQSKFQNVSAGPRQVKAVEAALSELTRVAKETVEVTGIRGVDEHRTVLWQCFGEHNPAVLALVDGVGERFSWTVTAENHKAVAAALLEQLPAAQALRPVVDRTRAPEDEAARLQVVREATEQRERERAEADAAAEAILARRPADAAALIIAELDEDTSEVETDYHNHRVTRRVAIGWRTGARESFHQLRRAAAGFPETAHLGPDAPDEVEHRENYSMGGGNYLKAGGGHSSGWRVSSLPIGAEGKLPSWGRGLEDGLPAARPDPAVTCSSTGFLARPGPVAPTASSTVLQAENKRGPFWLVTLADRLERPEFERLRASAQATGGWYSRAWRGQPGGFGFSSAAAAEAWRQAELGGGPALENRCRATWTAGGTGACPNTAELERDGTPCCAECYHDAEPGPVEPSIAAEHRAAVQCKADDLAAFQPAAELKFDTFLDLARQVAPHGTEMERITVRRFAGSAAALLRIPGCRTCEVFDNGGEMGIALVDDGALPEMVPLRVCAGLIDPWDVWLAVRDSVERLSRGEDGRGGDAPFPRFRPEVAPTPAPVPDSPAQRGRVAQAERLEALADRAAGEVKSKRAPLTQNWTPRRARIKDGQKRAADRLEQVERGLRALARALRENRLPGLLAGVTTRVAVERAVDAGDSAVGRALAELVAAGLGDETRAADLERRRAEEVRALEDQHRGRGGPGFFPTPPAVAARMLELLELGPGVTVLEPSAGLGHLAEACRDAGASVTCVEIAFDLCEVLERKGFAVLRGDFLETGLVGAGSFDRVAMNPPFERGADLEHVRAAAGCLSAGGRLVAVMTPGGAAAAVAELGGRREALPDGSFQGPGAFRATGVRTALYVLDR